MNKRFKQIREENKMSQKKVAEIIGISDAALSKIESGQNNPSDRTIKLFCQAFKVHEEWLRTGKGDIYISNSSEYVEHLVQTHNLSQGHKLLLLAVARAFEELDEESFTILMEALFDKLQELKQEPSSQSNRGD